MTKIPWYLLYISPAKEIPNKTVAKTEVFSKNFLSE